MTTEPAAGNAEPADPPVGLNVLLVESEDVPARLYGLRFRLEGFRVTRARDGAEAVSAAGDGPDAVLLDLGPTAAGGLQTLERIRSRLHDRSVPVIVLVPDGQDELAQRLLKAGAQECVVRSRVGPGELARAIRDWASRRSSEPELVATRSNHARRSRS
jgi:DNA-binding response OmpR family regulator